MSEDLQGASAPLDAKPESPLVVVTAAAPAASDKSDTKKRERAVPIKIETRKRGRLGATKPPTPAGPPPQQHPGGENVPENGADVALEPLADSGLLVQVASVHRAMLDGSYVETAASDPLFETIVCTSAPCGSSEDDHFEGATRVCKLPPVPARASAYHLIASSPTAAICMCI